MKRFAIILALPLSASLQAAEPTTSRPPQFDRLIACKKLLEPSTRLRCFDEATTALERAEAAREVVILDKAQMRETRKSLFGLSLPRLRLFGRDDDVTEEVKEVQAIVTGTGRDADGRLMFTLQDGARWHQIDDRPLSRRIGSGTKVTLRRASLGSYFAQFEGFLSARVKREN